MASINHVKDKIPIQVSLSFSLSGILNFCANNYLGLSSHPEVVQAGIDALKTHGAGLSSVRFICGTQVWWLFYYSEYHYKNKSIASAVLQLN